MARSKPARHTTTRGGRKAAGTGGAARRTRKTGTTAPGDRTPPAAPTPRAAKTARRASGRKATRAQAPRGAGQPPRRTAALFAPLPGSDARVVGGVQLDVVRAGAARVKREIYPPGYRWSRHMKPITGTDLCMHAHVGFLAHGEIHIEYADGCIIEHRAPQVVAIEPGHDGWVVGGEPVVLIEFDFERDTIARLGMPAAHRHD